MRFRKIGSLEVSGVGLGANNFGWRLDEEHSKAVIHAALDAGINFFDAANTYGEGDCEEFIGRALGSRRDEVVIATKVGRKLGDLAAGVSADQLRVGLEGSLQRLNTDWIDLLIIHDPDPKTPIEETIGALGELVRTGKVREIGCSNFSLEDLQAAEKAAESLGVRIVNAQDRYSLVIHDPERGVLPECEHSGIGFVAAEPLARGLLTGKYTEGRPPPSGTRIDWYDEKRHGEMLSERSFRIFNALKAFCEARGHTTLELAFSFLLAHPAVSSVVAGASNRQQIDANAAAGEWLLTSEELEEVQALAPID